MSDATFTLSAFGDEISPDLDVQLSTLSALGVRYLDLRGAWGKNVLRMGDDDLARVVAVCNIHSTQVACLGSPIGKSPIMDPIANELANLERIMHVGEVVGCRRVRLFSFYPPDISTNVAYDQYVPEATERLAALARLAEREGYLLLLENEKDIVTDTLSRCEAVIKGVNSPVLRFIWDSANFVQVGEAQVVDRGWPMLGEAIGYVHIKDAMLSDGHVVAAGHGDGQLRELLTHLKDAAYQGFLSLEPHLQVAGHSGGFTGPEMMGYAVGELRKLMAEVGCVEI